MSIERVIPEAKILLPFKIRLVPVVRKREPSDRRYPLLVTSKCRCWKCHIFPNKLYWCTRCHNVRYCSRECQQSDWKTHQQACHPLSTYNMEHFAIITVSNRIPPHSCEIPPILRTAIELIDKHHIHPDHLRITTRKMMYTWDWDMSEFLFDLTTYATILPFLERGLSPQKMMYAESFYGPHLPCEKIIDIVLEYGDGRLRFPRQHYDGMVKYLILRGLDPEEVIDQEGRYTEPRLGNILFLAACGYNFYHRDWQGRTRLDIISESHPEYRASVEDAILAYTRGTKELIRDVLIPDLGDIVSSYL